MSRRFKVGAVLLLSWFALAPARLAALNTGTPAPSVAQSDGTPLGTLAEPVVLLLLGLLLAAVGIFVRRASEKRVHKSQRSPSS
jgi:hypothetical protein